MEIHDIISWFQLEFPGLVADMKNSDHHFTDSDGNLHLNPFHLEGDVWVHNSMVLAEVRNRGFDNFVKFAALCHDLGKPLSRHEAPEKFRARFSGHEGISVFLGMDVINRWNEQHPGRGFSQEEAQSILELVCWHQEIFREMVDGRPSKTILQKLACQDMVQVLQLLELMTADGFGRISSTDPRNEEFVQFLPDFEAQHLASWWLPVKSMKNSVNVLIGPPGSGKSTWVERHQDNAVVISRDDIIMELAPSYMDYNQAFASVDQNKVNSLLDKKFQEAKRGNQNIIIDMTNMSAKSRRKWLNGVPRDWSRKATVFCTPFSELMNRNRNRPGKMIPERIIVDMLIRFHAPFRSEFDEIKWRF